MSLYLSLSLVLCLSFSNELPKLHRMISFREVNSSGYEYGGLFFFSLCLSISSSLSISISLSVSLFRVIKTLCSAENAAYYHRSLFLQQPMSSCYDDCMVNNNNNKAGYDGGFNHSAAMALLVYCRVSPFL